MPRTILCLGGMISQYSRIAACVATDIFLWIQREGFKKNNISKMEVCKIVEWMYFHLVQEGDEDVQCKEVPHVVLQLFFYTNLHFLSEYETRELLQREVFKCVNGLQLG